MPKVVLLAMQIKAVKLDMNIICAMRGVCIISRNSPNPVHYEVTVVELTDI